MTYGSREGHRFAPGAWSLAPWSLVLGVWCLEFGAWSLVLGVWRLEFFDGRGVFSESAVVLRMLKNACLELPMLPPCRDKPRRLQLAEAASAKLGKAIARSQSSLVA